MIRILLLLLPVLLVYFAIRGLQKSSNFQARNSIKIIIWILLIGLLMGLMVTGKLNGVFALIGVVIAFLVKLIPNMLRYAPQLHRLWQLFSKNQQTNQQASGRDFHSTVMTVEQALQVLGLKSDASRDEIVEAHRKLIAKLHPDKGGSDYLAAQINLAKKVLLSR